MFRIDDPTAAAALPAPEAAGTPGYFTEGSPGSVSPTLVRASFLNMLQEEFMAVLVAAGITPSKTTYNQLLAALNASYAKLAGLSTQVFSVAAPTAAAHATPLSEFAALLTTGGYVKIPVIVAGVKRTLIVQWIVSTVAASSTSTVTLPIPWPNAGLVAVPGSMTTGMIAVNTPAFSAQFSGLTQVSLQSTYNSSSINIGVIMIGW